MKPPEEKIVQLPVKKRKLEIERVFRIATFDRCRHNHGYIVDGKLAEVTCAGCKEKLNPIWVLEQLMNKEHRFHELHERYQDEMKRLGTRSKTKCQHCQKMTRISQS